MTSEGQRWALGQLEEIADASDDSLEIIDVRELPSTRRVRCRSIFRLIAADILVRPREFRFRARERLTLYIPAAFPLNRPDVQFGHNRYGHYPHVQWGIQICLYQSTDSEWQPDDGMFGYMSRLDTWLRHAARGEFDPCSIPVTSARHLSRCWQRRHGHSFGQRARGRTAVVDWLRRNHSGD